jgi:FlaA1/EpsC-like NDP-sugar epimerase
LGRRPVQELSFHTDQIITFGFSFTVRFPFLRQQLPDIRTLIAIAHDAIWAIAIWLGGNFFRFSVESSPISLDAWATLPVVVGIQLISFQLCGLYRGIWRFASFHDLRRMAFAIALSSAVISVTLLLWQKSVPRSLLIIDPLLLMVFMASGRIFYRWWKEELPLNELRGQGKPVILLAANISTIPLAAEFNRSPNWKLIGVLDDDRRNKGREIAGVPVLGGWEMLPELVNKHRVGHVILSDNNVDHNVRRRAYELADKAHAKLMLLPRVDDLLSGRIRYAELRDVEVEDLLGRDPVELDTPGIVGLIKSNVVLVTGAGGSIGSELCRQVARFDPSLIVLLEHNEFALYAMEQEFHRIYPKIAIACVIGDVKDSIRLKHVMDRYSPKVIFHAAAYKHVPMTEQENAWQAVQNNTLGTLRLAKALEGRDIDKLVFISTDKAVNPTSVMGATKRLGELILQQWSKKSGIPTVAVRFGNVLGSTGSVIPKFKEQIARGGPITVTHPDMRRYFMSVPEACELVLQSASMGKSGEIFVLEMGEPVKIVDLARDLIRFSGASEDEISIVYTGLRPGEKLYEELMTDDETTMPTVHQKVRIARAGAMSDSEWERKALAWLQQEGPLTDEDVRAGLAKLVPDYTPYDAQKMADLNNVIPLRPRVSGKLN